MVWIAVIVMVLVGVLEFAVRALLLLLSMFLLLDASFIEPTLWKLAREVSAR